MPSTYTPSLGLEKQAAGENLNTWGDTRLNNVIQRTDKAIAGYLAVAITGDYTLTSSNSSTSASDYEARHAHLKFTGTLSANATISIPAVSKSFRLWNYTNKQLTISTGAGATVAIDTLDVVDVWSDGVGVYQLSYAGLSIKDYIAAQVITASGSSPAVTGNAGKFLYTDGVTAYWKQANTTDLGDYLTQIVGKQIALAVAL